MSKKVGEIFSDYKTNANIKCTKLLVPRNGINE